MPILQLLETILVIYVLFVGCVALTMYIITVSIRFFREARKQHKE